MQFFWLLIVAAKKFGCISEGLEKPSIAQKPNTLEMQKSMV